MACDVALGQEFETTRDKYMDKAQVCICWVSVHLRPILHSHPTSSRGAPVLTLPCPNLVVQPGTQCTHALGKFAPLESGMVDDGTGCMMPLGM